VNRHLFFVASPAAGHVNPLLPVMAELGRRGHRVTFASGPEQGPAAAAVGARVVELPWTLDPTSLSRDRFSTTSFVELLDGLVETAAPRLDAVVADAEAGGTDLVCFDATVAPVGIAVAERLGVPAISCIPSMAVNEHLPLAELLPPDFRPDNEALARYAGRLHDFSVKQGLTALLAPMAVPPVPLTLVFVPPAFQIAADTFDPSYRFVGPTLRPDTSWQPPADGRPLALVSLGSAFTDRPDVFRACAAAFADTGWQVVMSIGRTPRAALGSLPGNVQVAPALPQQAILRHASAFVSHAGMNSIMEALSCAVPLVTLPQVPEQDLNARRVKELGLGQLLDGDNLTPDRVRAAVLDVAADQQVRERLKWMAGEIAAAGGASAAADAILAQLERRPG
jgi:MGT family glycosyltransferase